MIDYTYIFLFLFSVSISSLSQIILKFSALKKHKDFNHEYLNKHVILAYILFLLSTILTIFSYKHIPLHLGPVLETTGYIYISVLSYLIFKERMNKKQLLGMLLIIVGIIIFSI